MTGRPRTATASLCALMMFVLAACTAGGDDLSDDRPGTPITASTVPSGSTQARIAARGKVVIGVKYDVPLFGYRDPATGRLDGFDIEMADVVAGALFPGDPEPRSRITFVEALSKDRERFLQQGTVDMVISTYTITDARKLLVDFAGPYYIAGQDILARAEDVRSGRINGVSDLNGKKVCAVTGSTSLANLKAAAPDADTSVSKERYPECFQALQRGEVEAMTTDDVILLGLARGDPGRFALTGNPFHSEPYGIGIPKGDSALRALVSTALQSAFTDGRWAAAFSATVGQVGGVTPPPPTLDR